MTVHQALLRSDTRIASHNSIKPLKGMMQRTILNHLAACAPKTCEEVELDLGMRHSTCSARLGELVAKGLVYTSGERPTSSRRMARLYWVR